MKYSMTCTCGHTMETEAGTREEAVMKFKGMMGPEAAKKHMAEKHPGEPVPSQEELGTMIEQSTKEVM